jgi:hypothetical protein
MAVLQREGWSNPIMRMAKVFGKDLTGMDPEGEAYESWAEALEAHEEKTKSKEITMGWTDKDDKQVDELSEKISKTLDNEKLFYTIPALIRVIAIKLVEKNPSRESVAKGAGLCFGMLETDLEKLLEERENDDRHT